MAQLLRGKDACFDKNIKTIQLLKAGSEMTVPIIELNSSEQLTLSFDDLSNESRNFKYKIIHCDADWSKSNLFYSDYINGFEEDNIYNYQSSFNTLVSYIHYKLNIPNDNMRITASGNYLLQVFNDDGENELVFQKSFSVVEYMPQVKIKSSSRNIPLAGNPKCSQQIEFNLEYSRLNVQIPQNDIKVRIEQNGFRQPGIAPPSPTFTRSGYIDYTQYNKNVYTGVSEFRNFDITSFEYRSLTVRKIQIVDKQYHVLLDQDKPPKQYLYQRDINGSYVVRNVRYEQQSDTESDYANVHFSLFMPEPLNGNVYLFGQLTNGELTNSYSMLYNSARQCYELTLLVKQGYYNYKYVYIDESGEIDWSAIDGCSSESENVYGIYVYNKGTGDRYDKLVNVTWLSSQSSMNQFGR
jgi:hypothetical protein